jgi:hypothetical protein
VEENPKVMGSDSWVDHKMGVRVRWVAQSQSRDWVAKVVTPMVIAEGNEVCLVGINAQPTAGHPVHNKVEVGGDKVCRSNVVSGDGHKGAIVDIKLCTTVHPPLGQAEEGGCVESRQNGGYGRTLGSATVHGVGQAREGVEAQGGRAIRQEGKDPVTDQRGETKHV